MARSGPNVVLFISDQQRADTMPSVRAATGIRTPHLEWLAEQSTLFRNAYCATPICSPARATLLSGLYPHTTGMVANHQERAISNELHLSPDVRVLADYLRPLGYACAYTGKWHLGTGGDRRGFSDFVTRIGDHDVDGPDQNDVLRFVERVGVTVGGKHDGYDLDPHAFDRRTRVGTSLLPLAFYPSTRDAMAAARFVRQMAGDPRPFLLVYSCHEPHPPFASPRPFDSMYLSQRDALPLPESRRDEVAALRTRHGPGWKLRPAESSSDDDLRTMWAAYYGAISFVDHLVGLILEALLDTDQWDDTLFVYTSDHGEMLGSHGLLQKGAVLFEELVNIPLLIRPPGGRSAAHQTQRLAGHADLAPTVLRWCGADLPAGLHGADLRALIEGGDKPVHQGVALEHHSSNWGEPPTPLRGWRTEDWKYVEGAAGGEELYDLRADPLERHNLINDPAAAGVREQMRQALHAWMSQTGDSWPEIPIPPRLVSSRSPRSATPLAAL